MVGFIYGNIYISLRLTEVEQVLLFLFRLLEKTAPVQGLAVSLFTYVCLNKTRYN